MIAELIYLDYCMASVNLNIFSHNLLTPPFCMRYKIKKEKEIVILSMDYLEWRFSRKYSCTKVVRT